MTKIVRKVNRMATQRVGKAVWCYGCDAELVSSGSKCSRCGSVMDGKRVRASVARSAALHDEPAEDVEAVRQAMDVGRMEVQRAVWGALAPAGCEAYGGKRGLCDPLTCDCPLGDFDNSEQFIEWVTLFRTENARLVLECAGQSAMLAAIRAKREAP